MPSEFRYVVLQPDPEAARIRDRKQGMVHALSADGNEAGFLTYGLGPEDGCISVTMVETHEPYRRRGCARGMVLTLQAAYPTCDVVDGGGSNSAEGDLLRESLEALRNSLK